MQHELPVWQVELYLAGLHVDQARDSGPDQVDLVAPESAPELGATPSADPDAFSDLPPYKRNS